VSDRLRLLLDAAIGETRAVLLRDDRPERLIIDREDGPDPRHVPGARVRARLRGRLGALAFLDLGAAPDAAVSPGAVKALADGAILAVEITAAPRRGKGPSARVLGPDRGPVGLVAPGPDLSARLAALAPGVAVERGPEAGARIDAAVDEALATETRLPGGGRLTIEPTRALIAVDVDFADAATPPTPPATRRLNRLALAETARRLRLSGLGGLVVIDLIGADVDGEEIRAAAKAAFAPDAPGVVIGPVTRFGVLELARPWRDTPLREILLDPNGRPSPLTAALDLLRRIEQAGRADPGGRLLARAAPEVVEAAQPYLPRLVDRIGARFALQAELAFGRDRADVTSR
jgi:hypothetical protein